MIDFKEELKKYKPILEVDDIETSIQSDEIQDIEDLLQNLSKKLDNKE